MIIRPDILDRTSVEQEAAALWGRAAANLIIDNLIEETALANEALPLIEPVKQIFVDIRPLTSDWKGLYPYLRLEDLMPSYILDPNSEALAILEQVQGAPLHESAHRAHYQHMQQQKIRLSTTFGLVLREGVAVHAVEEIDDAMFGTNERFAIYEREEALNTLIDLLYNQELKFDTQQQYEDYLNESTATVDNKGYHAARHVVALFALARRCDTETLMKTSIETYKEFVEHEL